MFRFTIITSTLTESQAKNPEEEAKKMCKSYSLLDGELVAESYAHLTNGVAETQICETLFDYLDARKSLTPYQCILAGVPAEPKIQMITRGYYIHLSDTQKADYASRTRSCISFPLGAGLWLRDYDPRTNSEVLTFDELRQAELDIFPELRSAPTLYVHSSSSYIRRKSDGKLLKAEGGKRAITIVDCAARIPELTTELHRRAILSGRAWAALNSRGAIRVKSLYDTCISTPEHIDYAALPVLGDDLEFAAEKHESRIYYGDVLIKTKKELEGYYKNPRTLLPKNERDDKRKKTPIIVGALETASVKMMHKADIAKVANKIDSLKHSVAEESNKVAGKWIDNRLDDIEKDLRKRNKTLEAGEREKLRIAMRQHKCERLPGECVVYYRGSKKPENYGDKLDGFETVRVSEVLDNPAKWENKRFLDALEPRYHDCEPVMVLIKDVRGHWAFWSHAGGGVMYALGTDTILSFRFTVGDDEYTTEMPAQDIADYMSLGDVGDGELLESMLGDKLRPLLVESGKDRAMVYRKDKGVWEESHTHLHLCVGNVLRSAYGAGGGAAITLLDDEIKGGARERLVGLQFNPRMSNAWTSLSHRVRDRKAEYDQQHYLMAFADGTLDLETGEFREHRADDKLTKVSPYAFGAGTPPSQRWDKMMLDVMCGDRERVEFLRRWFGLAMTGESVEKFLFFYGSGQNFKGTLLDIYSALFGNYAVSIDIKTLIKGASDTRKEEAKVRLRGARLAIAEELPKGAVMDGQALKVLNGNNEITCRELYVGSYSFRGTHKMVMTGNNKPVLDDATIGFRRRFLYIPFHYHIPKPKHPSEVRAYFLEDASGVIQWYYQGWRDYVEAGHDLMVPPSVSAENDAFMDAQTEQEPVVEFVRTMVDDGRLYMQDAGTLSRLRHKDRLSVGDKVIHVADLYDMYCDWAVRNGERGNVSKAKFKLMMSTHLPQIPGHDQVRPFGAQRGTARQGYYYYGLGLSNKMAKDSDESLLLQFDHSRRKALEPERDWDMDD